MKLLLVNYEFPPVGGGAANATGFLARALVAQGHDVTVLTTAFGALRGVATEDGVAVLRVRSGRRNADRSTPVEMLAFLFAALVPGVLLARRRGFDAAIAFFTIPSAPLTAVLRLLLGIPYVVSLRGGDVPSFVPEIRALHAAIAPLRRALLKRACAVVANSESLARLSESIDPFPVQVIPNGVDTSVFMPAATPHDAGDAFRILFVGRLNIQKNVDALIESIATLATLPGPRAILEIVGDGPERPSLERLATQRGVAASLRWSGWLAKPEVIASYQRADVFVNPSFYEGMPNTILEAMACALPVVATRIGGNDDLVVEGETGFLVGVAAPNEVTEALQRLRTDPKLGVRLGARGRQRVTQDFDWARVATRYVELLAGGAPARRTA